MTRTLWFAVFGGHVAWTAHLLVGYFLASLACASSGSWSGAPLHVTTISALAVTVAGVGAGRAAASQRGTPEQRFIGRFGIALSAVFLFAIVLAGAAGAFLPPCA